MHLFETFLTLSGTLKSDKATAAILGELEKSYTVPKKVKGQFTIFQIIEHHTFLKDVTALKHNFIRCVITIF